ncbi:hypothetical protein ANN_15041 [Periplaneta americana]|uniref:DUF4817 domain-containing protein n=1 Tax=Periplaneta americana TaxID=6978 RepID=A0ABQ8SZ38_PERAM|nr:hypothetical protein ANN_15041 [Periplaneta americana]
MANPRPHLAKYHLAITNVIDAKNLVVDAASLNNQLKKKGALKGYLASELYEGDNAGEMSPGSSTESYLAFARIGLMETPEKPQPATQRAYQREFGVRNPPKRNIILGLVNKLETTGSLPCLISSGGVAPDLRMRVIVKYSGMIMVRGNKKSRKPLASALTKNA